ncbi:MAG TPA: OpgC domain-containing protein [Bryobacteraceae bacterium]|nr:OpgC domain-containing protein [Bryobacteraceae bacterium]
MASAHPAVRNTPSGSPAPTQGKRRGRLVELDVLRGFLLLWMTLTHLPTKANLISNQTFGFVSGAEGFIFLAAFMVGQLEYRVEQKSGAGATVRDLSRRTLRIYLYHCALLVFAFTLVAEFGVSFHRLALQNLLSFYLQQPQHAAIAAALLLYRPSLLDILPMYIVFMALTPLARKIARRWTWDPVVYISFGVWAAAEFGLRAWIYRHVNLFGLSVPEASTGAFDVYAWQLLWMVGLALGTIYAESVAGTAAPTAGATAPGATEAEVGIPGWLLKLSIGVALVFLVLRYSPVDHWMNPDKYGWLIDKWHLGPGRLINFAALSIVLVRFGARIAALPFIKPLASLGQASIEVFSVHVLCCLAGHALSPEADAELPLWQQAILLPLTIAALFLTAYLQRKWTARKRERATAAS